MGCRLTTRQNLLVETVSESTGVEFVLGSAE